MSEDFTIGRVEFGCPLGPHEMVANIPGRPAGNTYQAHVDLFLARVANAMNEEFYPDREEILKYLRTLADRGRP